MTKFWFWTDFHCLSVTLITNIWICQEFNDFGMDLMTQIWFWIDFNVLGIAFMRKCYFVPILMAWGIDLMTNVFLAEIWWSPPWVCLERMSGWFRCCSGWFFGKIPMSMSEKMFLVDFNVLFIMSMSGTRVFWPMLMGWGLDLMTKVWFWADVKGDLGLILMILTINSKKNDIKTNTIIPQNKYSK